MDKEKWVEIYSGLYSISDKGRCKANERIVESKTGPRHYSERLLVPELTSDGHLRVTLSNGGQKNRVFVYRLVAEAFVPNPNNCPIVNHKDENPGNNKTENLEWCTISYNNNYNGRNKKIGDKEGIDIKVYDKDNNHVETFPSITKAAKAYNISLTTLWRRVEDGQMINNHYFKKDKI